MTSIFKQILRIFSPITMNGQRISLTFEKLNFPFDLREESVI